MYMDMSELARHLDFANHHPNATTDDIRTLCGHIMKHGFHAAFVNPIHVALAKKTLGKSGVVGTAISFPLGQDRVDIKITAALKAIEDGADELDIVPNTASLIADPKGTSYLEEMVQIVRAIRQTNAVTIIKFIIETGYLTPPLIQTAARLIHDSGADYVKFATGMGPKGATLEDLALIKEVVGPDMKIKVAGGVDTYQEAVGFINAGVTRIGTSHALEIISNSPSASSDQRVSE
jgi:deoxyribose-phosphate aldolase